MGWKFDASSPLSRAEQKRIWREQSKTNVMAKKSIEAFGWTYDPTNPWGREEQKKNWQEEGHKNFLAKQAVDAFKLPGMKYENQNLYCVPYIDA